MQPLWEVCVIMKLKIFTRKTKMYRYKLWANSGLFFVFILVVTVVPWLSQKLPVCSIRRITLFFATFLNSKSFVSIFLIHFRNSMKRFKLYDGTAAALCICAVVFLGWNLCTLTQVHNQWTFASLQLCIAWKIQTKGEDAVAGCESLVAQFNNIGALPSSVYGYDTMGLSDFDECASRH